MNDDFKAQLTTLALEELPADEREKLEASFAEAHEAESYLRETREFCQLLTQTLASPAEAELTEAQRATLTSQLTQPGAEEKIITFPQARRSRLAWGAGIGAAAAALAIGGYFANQPQQYKGVARLEIERTSTAISSPLSDVAASEMPLPSVELRQQAQKLAENSKDAQGGQKLDGLVAANEGDGRAQQLLDRLDDAEFYNPATSKEHEANVAQVKDGLEKAIGYADLGEYDKAKQNYNDVLKIDRYNTAARRGLEGMDRRRSSEDLLAANDNTRAKMLRETDKELETTTGKNPLFSSAQPINLNKPSAATPALLASALATPEASAAPADATPPAQQPANLITAARGIGPDEAFGALPYSDAPGLSLSEEKPESYFKSKQPNTEAYAEIPENPFVAVGSEPLSTFSIDVDTASYANVRRFLNQGQRPPRASVRLEELVNYFKYTYPQPEAGKPFSVTVEMTECPWQPQHRLARIGLQGKEVAREERPAANLVFLIDVSGSMDEPNKLPLVKQSLHLLTGQLKGSDHVALVTYASGTGVALPSTSLEQKDTVRRAIDSLTAGGSTNGASGLQLAYQQARQHFKKDGVNRVILATDGDFNVGLTSRGDLEKLITDEAKSGVFLSVLGYGMGNLKDATMELLADKGNGNYAYIDSLGEARKVLADQVQGTLVTIAKDVKIQIEFNPAVVRNYRLLGYENRMLAKEDFNDDTKDAGEIGAGHTVTALYEIVPMSAPAIQPPVDALKYQATPAAPALNRADDSGKSAAATASNETMTVKLRYKQPDGDVSQLIEVPVVDNADATFAEAPGDFKFAASVAMYGLLLKDSAHKGSANWNMVRDFARAGKGSDAEGYRGEFLQLVEKAAGVAP